MKKTQVVSAGIAFVLVITFSLHAQEPAIMVPSAQPDSIVGIVAKAQGLQLVSPDQVPLCGTFWTVLPGLGGGVIPSSPCPPLDPSLPIYQIADGQFLVDETGGQVAVNTRRFGLQAQATSSTAAAVVAAQADAVLNLITQVQTAVANQPVRTMARAMGMDVPSPGDGQQLFAYTFDTNQLWLEITNLANGLANLNLHNATNQVYAIWCTTNLLADWNVATEVWPTNAEVMPCTVPTLERQNLFLRAEDWTGVDANGNGLPDWWEFKYFGYVGVDPDSSPDGNGQSLLYDYQNGFDPTDYYNGNLPILTVLTGNNQIGLPNQFLPVPLTMLVANTNGSLLTNAPVTLTVAQGGGSFASIPNETTSSSIQLRTDTNGQVAVWFESSPVFSSTNYAIVLAQSGTNITQTNFTEIAGAIPMNAVGGERIMALTASGDVVSRGGNLYGELGDYTFLDSSNVVHVVGLTNIVKIASGLNHALAIDSTGALWAWGDNEFGQLGDGGMEGDTNVPVHVLGMTNSVVAVAGGYNHSVVFKADGTVWTWGYNESGQLGVGNTDNTNIPVQVEGLPTNAVAVAAGYNHTLALLSDGTVWAWGDDFFNQLGDGLGTESDTPVQVPGLTGIAAICAGGNHNLALDTNGNAWAWGSFILFQPVPNIVFGPPGVAGKFAKANAEDNGDWPAMVAGLTNVVGLAAGASHSLLLDNEGRLWAWGSDAYGQFGDGGPDNNGGQYDADLPIQVRNNIIAIAAGSDASVVLDGNGNLWQCGDSDGDDTNWQWGDENGFPMMAPQYVDFYSGQLPGLKILNGNNQAAHAGLEFPQLLFFQVTDPNGAALSNAPVSVEVIEGDMALRTVSGGDNYKGLRLTTDANGEVSLTGYADRNFSNPNCFVRVLAASREQIAEADFNETLLPLPTISITSPTTGSSLLVGPNQTLTITVDAEAAPGASIQEVDYYYGTNGTADTLLGVLTQSPYSFIWTNSLWWTNAFVGQYTLSAVAVDNTGGQSDPQSVAFTVALDSDGGGLPDWWQLQYFGQLGVDPNADPDGDGISNLQEYQNDTAPTDYYNGNSLALELVEGNDQNGTPGSFLPLPVVVEVRRINPAVLEMLQVDSSVILTNAPVTFTVTNGTALLALTTSDSPTSTLSLRTDSNGRASVWVYFPPAGPTPPDSTIFVNASSGDNSTVIAVNEYVPLGYWTFNDTNTWAGQGGQLPLMANNLVGIPSWSSNAVLVDSASPALLAFNVVETNGNTNITCQTGSVMFWFKPDWSSADQGGTGPGASGRLIEMGSYSPDFTNGWWSLYFNPEGTQILFATSTNGGGMTNLIASISWISNEWCQIALTYSPDGSALYVDGGSPTGWPTRNGSGVAYFPNADELANGFRIGSDQNGNNQAGGAFDELETFNYPLPGSNTYTHGSDIPDWWEIYHFNTNGLNPDASFDGSNHHTLLYDYVNRYYNPIDPNPLQFVLNLPLDPVTTNRVNGTINVSSGAPAFMAVLLNDTNQADAVWQPFTPAMTLNLDEGNGLYNVLVGMRAAPADAPIVWHSAHAALYSVPLALAVTSPTSTTVSQPMIQVQGLANEALASLGYDVSNAAGIFTNQTGFPTGQLFDTNLLAFTTNCFQCYDVSLMNGLNTITLHATDLDGNTATTNISITLDYSGDTTPPMFSVVWPPDGAQISGSQFTLQGQVDDPTATITAVIVDAGGNTNTVQGLVERDGTVWVNNLPLAAGANTLTVTATDAAGNASAVNQTLYQGNILITMNPLSSDQLNQSTVTVTGIISDPSYDMWVNGIEAYYVDDGGDWEADNVPVSAGGTAVFQMAAYPGAIAQSSQKLGAKVSPMDASQPDIGLGTATKGPEVEVVAFSYEESSAYTIPYSGWPDLMNYVCSHLEEEDWAEGVGGTSSSKDTEDILTAGGLAGGLPPEDWTTHFEGSATEPLPGDTQPPKSKMEHGTYGTWSGTSSFTHTGNAKTALKTGGVAVPGVNNLYLVKVQVRDENTHVIPPAYVQMVPPQNLTPCPDDPPWSQFLVQASGGATVEMTPTAPASYYSWSFQVAQLDLQLAVDANRDGQITFDDADATTPNKPFRFWINDSKESGDDESAGGADDQIPSQSSEILSGGYVMPNANYAHNYVRGRSDLVNFFPVMLSLSNVLQWLPPTNGFEYHLVQNDSAVKFVYTSLTLSNAFDYLTNLDSTGYGTNADEAVTNADTIQVTNIPPGTVLDTNWLAQVQINGGTGVILVEGCAATKQPLWLEIWRNGKLLSGVPLYLSITNVEAMFRHLNLSMYGNGVNTVDSRYDAPNEPQNTNKNLVFLPGYNVNQQQSRGVESEMFKRFYWSRSKAKFYGVTWNGAVSQGDMSLGGVIPQLVDVTCNYQTNVVNALQTASHLADFLIGLPGETTVAAHSLGNMVVLSAISDYSAAPSHYFMIDAAVPIEAVQGNVTNEPTMIYSTWQDYSNRLYASDWWQLFTNDYRSTLTWSNRLGNLGTVDIYNFYSLGEEVLREDSDDPPSTVIGGVSQEVINYIGWFGNAGVPFGTYAWVWQEKGKGTAAHDWFIGSTHGGWKFSYYWVDSFGNPLSPSIMNDTLNSILQNQPMFSVGSSQNGPPDQDLRGDEYGSAFAQAHRDRILSDAIPALTLPVGANHVDKFAPRNGDDKNFNMQTSFETGWPAARSQPTDEEAYKWHHSDFDYVAYPFTYKLFNQIVTSGNLK